MIRINLLGRPRPKVKRRVAIAGTLQLLLFLIPLGLALGLLGLRYTLIQRDIKETDDKIAVKESEKREMGKLKSDIEQYKAQEKRLRAQQEVITDLQNKQTGPVKLLEAVGDTVSRTDTVWLTTMEEKPDNVVEFKGWAGSVEAVANLITNLNNSNYFENVEIKEAIQKPLPQGGAVNFEFTLSATFKLPAPPTSAQPGAAPAAPGGKS